MDERLESFLLFFICCSWCCCFLWICIVLPHGDIEFTEHNTTIVEKHKEQVFLRTDYYFVVEENNTKQLIDVNKSEYYTYDIGEWYNYTSPRNILN